MVGMGATHRPAETGGKGCIGDALGPVAGTPAKQTTAEMSLFLVLRSPQRVQEELKSQRGLVDSRTVSATRQGVILIVMVVFPALCSELRTSLLSLE